MDLSTIKLHCRKETWILITSLAVCLFFFSMPVSAGPGQVGNNSAERVADVTGKVLTRTGEPLIGAVVALKGTTQGVITNTEGSYSIAVGEGAVLVVSFIGYISREVSVNGQASIDIILDEEPNRLGEVVVTAFGISREKKTLSYSTQSVPVGQLSEARELNVINSLMGRVAGISIAPGATGVGSSSRVVLRGNRSISGDSQPLYVVDGVPVLDTPGDFNPEDIASVDVLKGPNAAALYGSDAQNGVIIMTTKAGSAKKGVRTSFSTTLLVSQANNGMDLQNEYGQGSKGIFTPSSSTSWGPKMDGRMVETWSLDPSRKGETYAFSPQEGNINDMLKTGFTHTENLQVAFNGERTRTFISATNTMATGVLPNNKLDRKNFLMKVSGDISSKLSVDGKLGYLYEINDNPTRTAGNNYNPWQQIYNIPRNIRTSDLRSFEFMGRDGVMVQDFWAPGVASTEENPYWVLYRNLSYSKRQRTTGMLAFNYKVNDNFNVLLRGGYDKIYSNTDEKDYNGTYIRAEKGRFTKTVSSRELFNADLLATYKKQLSQDWHVELNAGATKKTYRNYAFSSNTGIALLVPNFFSLSNTNLPATSYNPGAPIDIHSVYAFGKLGWEKGLYLDVTARNDWSSTLPANNRSYFYPSVGLTGVLSDLIPDLPGQISFAKARLSYAKVGNSPRPFMLERSAIFTAGGNNGFLSLSSVLPNSSLKPEITSAWEGGIDIRLFKNRLGMDITYYKTNTKNQLFTIEVPVGSGASSFYTNGGDVENRGIEILLNTTPVRRDNFHWDFNVNFSRMNNLVKKISDERPRVVVGTDNYMRDYVVEQGRPFGEMYSRGLVRDDQGRVIVGADGLPTLTNGKSFNMGSFIPDWQGGVMWTFGYKPFSLTMVIDHRQGGKVASYTNASLARRGLSSATLQGREGGLIFGQNFFGHETAVLADGRTNDIAMDAETFWYSMGNTSAVVGELFVVDATNTRLREFTLGYQLPESLLSRVGIASARVSLAGRNLFFLYRKDSGLDPEILVGGSAVDEGFSSYTPPSTRSYGLSLKIDF